MVGCPSGLRGFSAKEFVASSNLVPTSDYFPVVQWWHVPTLVGKIVVRVHAGKLFKRGIRKISFISLPKGG
jgi:hypothetical protein